MRNVLLGIAAGICGILFSFVPAGGSTGTAAHRATAIRATQRAQALHTYRSTR